MCTLRAPPWWRTRGELLVFFSPNLPWAEVSSDISRPLFSRVLRPGRLGRLQASYCVTKGFNLIRGTGVWSGSLFPTCLRIDPEVLLDLIIGSKMFPFAAMMANFGPKTVRRLHRDVRT